MKVFCDGRFMPIYIPSFAPRLAWGARRHLCRTPMCLNKVWLCSYSPPALLVKTTWLCGTKRHTGEREKLGVPVVMKLKKTSTFFNKLGCVTSWIQSTHPTLLPVVSSYAQKYWFDTVRIQSNRRRQKGATKRNSQLPFGKD
jgi:hypothetical protein